MDLMSYSRLMQLYITLHCVTHRSGSGITSLSKGFGCTGIVLIHDFDSHSEKVSVEADKTESLF